jgi:hypothetical protein
LNGSDVSPMSKQISRKRMSISMRGNSFLDPPAFTALRSCLVNAVRWIAKELFDLWINQVFWMTFTSVEDEVPYPVEINFLGAQAVMTSPEICPNLL